jgi:hypothetical protein
MGDWKHYGVCPCGFMREAPFGMLFHIHLEVCPTCGSDKKTWRVKVMRWVATGQLLRPSTWGTGHWEEPATPTKGR